jgi:hypothetical protein
MEVEASASTYRSKAMIPRLLAVSMAFGVGASAAQTPTPPPVDVAKLTISAPATIRDLDVKGARGVPTRMAWSLDDKWIYVRLSTFDRWSNETVRHLLVEVAGKGTGTLADEPGWLPRYWNTKSAMASPVLPSWRIKIDTRQETVRTANVPREGNIGMHGDPTAGLDETVKNAALSSQQASFQNYLLNGHVVAASVNGQVVPGRSFAWAPAPLPLFAYVNDKGRLVVMNHDGKTREVKGPKKPLLPAWSENGRRLAWVQEAGGGFSVRAVDIR